MPFDFKSIAEANSTELYTIHFSNDDFKNGTSLKDLQKALKSFQKLKFKLAEDITPKNKSTFIEFTINFLASHPKVIALDLSDNQLSADTASSQQATLQRGGETTEGRNVTPENPARGRKIRKGFRPIRYATDAENFDDLLKNLLSGSTLKEINLQNNFLFSTTLSINNIRGAITRGYTKLDLRNTHHEDKGERFTVEQLYTLIKPFTKNEKIQSFVVITTERPSCEILVSIKELPDNLQKKTNFEQDYINLTQITDNIFNAYKEECFNQKIELIHQNSESNTVITFPFPLKQLTEQETQQLADALKQNSTIKKLILPICHFSSLVPAIKNHPSIVEIKISALDHDGELLNGLKEIFSTNSKIQRLTCGYAVILQDAFKNVTEAVLNNPLSNLKYRETDELTNKYIELEDTDNTLSTNPTALKNLINKAKIQPPDITIVIDFSILEVYELEHELCQKKLLRWPSNSGYPCNYSEEEKEKLMKPLIFFRGKRNLILTPSYDTHSKIIDCIVSHLEQKEQEEAENAFSQEVEEEEIEQTTPDEQEDKQHGLEAPKNTAYTFSKSSTSRVSNTATETGAGFEDRRASRQLCSNTNENSNATTYSLFFSSLQGSEAASAIQQNIFIPSPALPAVFARNDEKKEGKKLDDSDSNLITIEKNDPTRENYSLILKKTAHPEIF